MKKSVTPSIVTRDHQRILDLESAKDFAGLISYVLLRLKPRQKDIFVKFEIR